MHRYWCPRGTLVDYILRNGANKDMYQPSAVTSWLEPWEHSFLLVALALFKQGHKFNFIDITAIQEITVLIFNANLCLPFYSSFPDISISYHLPALKPVLRDNLVNRSELWVNRSKSLGVDVDSWSVWYYTLCLVSTGRKQTKRIWSGKAFLQSQRTCTSRTSSKWQR